MDTESLFWPLLSFPTSFAGIPTFIRFLPSSDADVRWTTDGRSDSRAECAKERNTKATEVEGEGEGGEEGGKV